MRALLTKLRARGAMTLAAWVVCTGANVAIMSNADTPVDTDEIYWIGQTYYYHLAFESGEWRHPDWALIPARENPPAAKYVLGAGIAAQGFHIASLDLLGSFYAYFDVNLGRHPAFAQRFAAQDSVLDRMVPQLRRLVTESRQMYVAPELIAAGRRVALLCGVMTSLLVLLLGASVAGAGAGLLASQLLLLHPGVIGAYQHAMADAPAFMFGTAAVLATWLLLRRHCERADHSERSEESAVHASSRAAGVGMLLGLAVSAKLNWIIVAFLYGAAWTFVVGQALRRNDRQRATRAALIGVVGLTTSLLIYIATDPSILFDPVRELMTPVRELRLAAKLQAAVLPRPPFLSTVGARFDALASLVLWTPWAFVLAAVAIAAACLKAPRPGVWLVATWWGIAFVCVAAWIPFEWSRYALPLTIPTMLLGAYAATTALAMLRRRAA